MNGIPPPDNVSIPPTTKPAGAGVLRDLRPWLVAGLGVAVAAGLCRAQESALPLSAQSIPTNSAAQAQPPYVPPPPLPSATPIPAALRHFQLQITGATHFTQAQLRAAIADQLTTIEQSGLTPAEADDTAFFLGVFYRQHGYSQADVKWSIAPGNLLVLQLHEGPLTILRNVNFAGNTHFTDKTLLGYITAATLERLPGTQKAVPYVEADVRSGAERIQGIYRSDGYLNATVAEPEIKLNSDATRADVTVTIHEGIQYHFGKLTFQGDIIFFPQKDLLKELQVFTSKPYTPQAVINLERKVVYYYRTHGYFNAQVHAESDPTQATNGIVPVNFIVKAGDIYRFDGVTQKGLQRLRPSFLPARFKQLKGQVYNPEKIDKIYRDLMGTGLFSNLKLTQVPLPDHTVQLQFQVDEAKSKELGASIGYATLEGAFIGFRYTDRDVFGFGRPFTINTEIAENLLRGEVLYVDPWFLDTDYSLSIRGYALTQDFEGYSKDEQGVRVEASRKFLADHVQASVFALARGLHIINAGVDPAETGPINYTANSLGTSLTLDYRDSILNPTKGFVANTTFDWASSILGSSLNFMRTTFRFSYYYPIGKSILAFGLRGGIIWPLDESNSIPIDERFFNGGSSTVRSYLERTLGPRDKNGFPVGGQTFTNANIEYVFPIFDSLDGAVFADFGSVGRTIGSGFGETGYAIGPGLRYRLPIGPIRLDYGFNPVHGHNQPMGAVQFSFGFAF